MVKVSKVIMAAGAAFVACRFLQSSFVPSASRGAPVGAAAGMAAMLGAAPAYADKIDDAAEILSSRTYPFLKNIDWSQDYYFKVPGVDNVKLLEVVQACLSMGASMDDKALKAGVMAHVKAIGSVDSTGVTSLEDYTAINKALGHMIASVPAYKALDVYGAVQGVLPKEAPDYLFSQVSAAGGKYSADPQLAYQAFLDFKDVVKAAGAK